MEKARPIRDGMYTLEELCRAIWRYDQEQFRKMAEHSSVRLLIPQFEREGAERELRK